MPNYTEEYGDFIVLKNHVNVFVRCDVTLSLDFEKLAGSALTKKFCLKKILKN